MIQRTALVALLLLGLLAGPAAAHDEAAPEVLRPRSVDLVICLDTSGSMQGLIHAARQKLWSVVNELAALKPEPRLRVALLTYGTPGAHVKPGDVVIQTDLTTDLDLVSEKLFALGTMGGTELVGRVIHYALSDLSWSKDIGLKTLFVAGNESADQDKEKGFLDMAKLAKSRDIYVNAIYCGGADDGDAAGWRQLAALNGRFSNIDHNHGTVTVTTPLDAKLAELSGKLNRTYVFAGAERLEREERQREQDANATKAGAPAAAQRAEAKAGRGYAAPGDLVDALKKGELDAAELKDAELPEVMRAMTPEQRTAYLAEKAEARAKIQAEIQALSAERAAYVKKVMSEKQLDDSKSLDKALSDTIKEQAKAQGYK